MGWAGYAEDIEERDADIAHERMARPATARERDVDHWPYRRRFSRTSPHRVRARVISRSVIPAGSKLPPHVHEVGTALSQVEPQIAGLWTGAGIDGRRVAGLLKQRLPSWESERRGSLQALSWAGAEIRPFLVDGQRGRGRSIIEVEGGGALQNNRLHRDLLNAMLLDDVEHLVLVVPNRVHGRDPYEYAVAFAARLRAKALLPKNLIVTVYGYGMPRTMS
jgi:hypothetical protein